MRTPEPLYHRHRFPSAIISCAMRLYYRFQLSLRAVDQHGVELDILLRKRRDKAAAKHFSGRPLSQYLHGPDKIVTNKLRSSY